MPDKPNWLQLVCFTSKQNHQDIEAAMENSQALSITWQDAADTPVFEPLPGEKPLWEDLLITALFESNTDLTPLSNLLRVNKKKWDIKEFLIENIEDQDWERVWMKDYHPMRFGKNLWIYPSTHNPPDDDSTKILLDPGLAFGTGTHPTTALCLEWLDNNPPLDKSVIDYGCGSGVLALAAVKLGATDITATDIDPQALIATQENMRRNQIASDSIKCFLPDDCPQKPVDLLLANILCGPLHELFPLFSLLTQSGGQLVLSGLLEEQKEPIIQTYSQAFKDFEYAILDGWVRINATRM